MKNNRAPSLDGFNYEFKKNFFDTHKTFRILVFGSTEVILNWIETLTLDSKSVICQNGFLSENIFIGV